MANRVPPDAWQLPRLALAASIAGLGLLSVRSADFAFQWQPVPASLANHDVWATAMGWAEIVIGVALAVPYTATAGALAASALLAFWALLHVPDLEAHPLNVGAWNGGAEPLAIAAAALLIATAQATNEAQSSAANACARAFGAACIVFGTAHFVYAKFTASMVPSWLPLPLVLAYLTGAVHAGAGLALLIGYQRFIAAGLEAAMMTSFVLLVHLPRIAEQPDNRFEWTMGLMAVALSSSAWSVARHFRPREMS